MYFRPKNLKKDALGFGLFRGINVERLATFVVVFRPVIVVVVIAISD